MMTKHKARIITSLCIAFFLGFMFWFALADRSLRNAYALRDSMVLLTVLDKWLIAGEPEGEALEKFLGNYYGSFKPYKYTNSVIVDGKTYNFAFAIRDASSAHSGKLAVTREGVIIWLKKNSSRVFPINHHHLALKSTKNDPVQPSPP